MRDTEIDKKYFKIESDPMDAFKNRTDNLFILEEDGTEHLAETEADIVSALEFGLKIATEKYLDEEDANA